MIVYIVSIFSYFSTLKVNKIYNNNYLIDQLKGKNQKYNLRPQVQLLTPSSIAFTQHRQLLYPFDMTESTRFLMPLNAMKTTLPNTNMLSPSKETSGRVAGQRPSLCVRHCHREGPMPSSGYFWSNLFFLLGILAITGATSQLSRLFQLSLSVKHYNRGLSFFICRSKREGMGCQYLYNFTLYHIHDFCLIQMPPAPLFV